MYIFILFFVILLKECSGKQPLRVYDGEDARDAYPYIVRLEIRKTIKLANGSVFEKQHHRCTASALASTWAVTAAHCLKFSTDKLVIRYGSVHSLPNEEKSFSDVVLVIKHPMYIKHELLYLSVVKNDIGLMKTNPMRLEKFIKLSPVDYNTLYGHEVVACGFGITTKKISDNETLIAPTLTLRKPLQMFKAVIHKCRKESGFWPYQCLGQRCGSNTTVCGGDSGGPVIHASGIVAVLSLGSNNKYCGDPTDNMLIEFAGQSCPVGPYIEWILSYVKN